MRVPALDRHRDMSGMSGWMDNTQQKSRRLTITFVFFLMNWHVFVYLYICEFVYFHICVISCPDEWTAAAEARRLTI